ncbi:MAG: flagellar biosynthesis protein FlhA [Candidatus Latescibacteria bacterium]|nr:flagellar biosynthesis protein FlhA [Candidatus Latescibacterota bacterium]
MNEPAVNTKRSSTVSDAILALVVIAILGVMIVPVPPPVLDVLLSFNMVFAIIILLVTMYITRPLELSVFPGLLLVTTVFRLALNVASTRLILGTGDAGNVIYSFGTFVVQSNYVVGFIIFVIIIVIQFVVITKGATRIAEVSARFTLDAMPGKQMAIDADLNAGLVDEAEARRRRSEISREADFYGAMDGAAKFVRGDVIAGLIITVINIIGGFIIGIVQRDLSVQESLRTYTMLTVGDGLVTQIPALLMSTGAGMIVTRATSESNLGQDLRDQISNKPGAIVIAAIMIAVFGMIPGLPRVPFFILAVATGIYATVLIRGTAEEERKLAEEAAAPKEPPEERVEDYLTIDILGVEIGYGIIPIVDESQGGDFLERVTTLRRQIAQDLGIIVPPVRIRDNIRLGANEYVILIRGNNVAGGSIEPGLFLAMNPGFAEEEIQGRETIEPAFGLNAKWIEVQEKEKAELAGYTVVEPSSVLATHLSEVIKNQAHEILTRQDVQTLVDNAKRDYPVLVEDLIPQTVSLGLLQKVLKHLLRERVPVRDLIAILEAIGDYVQTTKDPYMLGEFARAALYRTITKTYIDDDGKLTVFTLSPQLEKLIVDHMQSTLQGVVVSIAPDITQKMLEKVGELSDNMIANDKHPVALVSSSIRFAFRTLMEINYPRLVVLAYNEVAPEVEIFSIGMVKIDA